MDIINNCSLQSANSLICGNVCGHFGALILKLNTLIKKNGSFDMLFCVGDFFGDDDEGNIKIEHSNYDFPLATYILGPNKVQHLKYYKDLKGCQLCSNVTYLGKSGIFTGLSNLSVAFLSGVDQGSCKEKSQFQFNSSDIDSLESSIESKYKLKGIDILLTSQWSASVDKYATQVGEPYNGSALISRLAQLLKPRYHFCSLQNISYERSPYRNHTILTEKSRHVTRFIALASYGNKEKKKFMYAFSIEPMLGMEPSELIKQPPDATEAPYDPLQHDKKESNESEPTQQFFYNLTPKGNKRQHENPRNNNFKRQNISPESCWFCLSNPNVEKHLVVSVGELCYLALAKGGLNDEHSMIVPVNHHASLTSCPPDVAQEMEIYKKSLTNYFKFMGKCVVFFERNYKTSHLQLQVVPLPEKHEDKLKNACINYCKDQNIDLLELPEHSDLTQIIPPLAPYFFIQLPNNQKFFFRVPKGFHINFGRMLMCQVALLNEPEKVDWKNCLMSPDDEKKCCTKMRLNFKSFDPFL